MLGLNGLATPLMVFLWQKFNTQHLISCQKGGFATICHNKLRDNTGALLEEACQDVSIEPILQSVTDNNLVPSTANSNDGARIEVIARSFWITGHFLTSGCFTPTLQGTSPEVLNSVLQ